MDDFIMTIGDNEEPAIEESDDEEIEKIELGDVAPRRSSTSAVGSGCESSLRLIVLSHPFLTAG